MMKSIGPFKNNQKGVEVCDVLFILRVRVK